MRIEQGGGVSLYSGESAIHEKSCRSVLSQGLSNPTELKSYSLALVIPSCWSKWHVLIIIIYFSRVISKTLSGITVNRVVYDSELNSAYGSVEAMSITINYLNWFFAS